MNAPVLRVTGHLNLHRRRELDTISNATFCSLVVRVCLTEPSIKIDMGSFEREAVRVHFNTMFSNIFFPYAGVGTVFHFLGTKIPSSLEDE